ncbi:DUF371 domain-containing protein [Vulcanisaeta distributa]|uniref:DUF371 domain-containing protein n=1 Tax=Vulcanisaeta distributa (strain DSM 14429 / JCM 11212 / NBRC 100878 / IC-017) TaxID=572478 RepID=E1QUK1_VULDI|nr:DUF371 domain-containing protein [Vulcanisaeta distributa]ADN51120.1 Protein of unknown function DUF371 [Vulcanisaeta distributa DSM 14429]
MVRVVIDRIRAWGHVNVRARHRTTIEITRDDYLTPRGDCIIGIKADKGLSGISPELKEIIKKDGSIVIAMFVVDDYLDYVVGMGSSKLTLGNDNKLIIRRSNYIDDATLMIRANKAAIDIDRRLIDRLKKESPLTVYIIGVDLEQDRTVEGDGT